MATLLDRATLLETIQVAYDRLDATLASLSNEQMTRPGSGGGEWAVKDALAHLIFWQRYTLRSLNGEKIQLGKEGEDNQATEDRVNAQVYAENRHRPLSDALAEFRDVYQQMRATVQTLPDERIAHERVQGLIAGNTYGHYAEHLQSIRTANGLA